MKNLPEMAYPISMKPIELITPAQCNNVKVSIPGSKSYTNRALIMAALTQNPVMIQNPLLSDDTDAMIRCLQKLQIRLVKKSDSIQVIGDIRDIPHAEYLLDARISGTTIRFITALASIVPGIKRIRGDEGLLKRPIGPLVEGLRTLGSVIDYDKKKGYPPLTIRSSHLTSHHTKLQGDVSSQYFSALLMIAPLAGGLTIEVEGNQISKSYVDMTIDMMRNWGIRVENRDYRFYIVPQGQSYTMKEYTVEGDYSAAGYFFAIAALTKSRITLENLNPKSAQGDRNFVTILENMGNKIVYNEHSVTIEGKGIRPVEVDMELCPDQAQTLAVLAAFADGVTTLNGVRSLRVKETERVKAIQAELAKMGIKTASPDNDTLIIFGGNPVPAAIDTYGDHRMAMSFAVAASILPGMKIYNPEVVNKTFPNFWNAIKTLGIQNQ